MQSKNHILSTSSIWVSALLNIVPGVGTGYIYQRRWKAYWITNFISFFWVSLDYFREISLDPSDPANSSSGLGGLLGLLLISTISAIEASFAAKRAREEVSKTP